MREGVKQGGNVVGELWESQVLQEGPVVVLLVCIVTPSQVWSCLYGSTQFYVNDIASWPIEAAGTTKVTSSSQNSPTGYSIAIPLHHQMRIQIGSSVTFFTHCVPPFFKGIWMGTSTLQANCTIESNQSYLPIEHHVKLFQFCVYIPTFILGLLFNGMAMTFAFRKIRRLTEPVIYMMTLMTLDTLLLFVLPDHLLSQKRVDAGECLLLVPRKSLLCEYIWEHPHLHMYLCGQIYCYLAPFCSQNPEISQKNNHNLCHNICWGMGRNRLHLQTTWTHRLQILLPWLFQENLAKPNPDHHPGVGLSHLHGCHDLLYGSDCHMSS